MPRVRKAPERVIYCIGRPLGGLFRRKKLATRMTYIVEIFLPVTVRDAERQIECVRTVLVERFGGATFHVNALAEGLWRDDGDTKKDQIVVAEVMVDDFDIDWWRGYRAKLEADFDQDEILIRAAEIIRI